MDFLYYFIAALLEDLEYEDGEKLLEIEDGEKLLEIIEKYLDNIK